MKRKILNEINNIGTDKVKTIIYNTKYEVLVKEVVSELGIKPLLLDSKKQDIIVSDELYYNEHITLKDYEEIMEEEYQRELDELYRKLEEEDDYLEKMDFGTGYNEFEDEHNFKEQFFIN